jgi:L-fuconolactonase
LNQVAPAVIDSHQHLWELDKVDYPWLRPEAGPIYRDFIVEDLEPMLAECGVARTVAVQSANSRADTDYLLGCADRCGWIAGVVGWVPLEQPDLCVTELDRLSRHPRFCGIRHLIHNEPDPAWLLRPAVLESLRELAARDLPFDVVAVWPLHLGLLENVLAAAPGLRLVVDHLAKPDLSRGVDPRWEVDLLRAAALPGVHAKFSGLNTPYDHPADWAWRPRDFVPTLEIAIDAFGVDRLMWGGDWPISVYNGGYRGWYEAAREAADWLSEDDQAKLFGGTASAFYRLDDRACTS